jgi:CYTH domain-containing protein
LSNSNKNNFEIERKFLVDISKVNMSTARRVHYIEQGYVFNSDKGVLRIRKSNTKYFLTIKSQGTLKRTEIEFEVPKIEGELLFGMCDNVLSKTRYEIPYEGKLWELDVFNGHLNGLVLAEVELKRENEKVVIPDWCIKEVTEDIRYSNSNLINSDINYYEDLSIINTPEELIEHVMNLPCRYPSNKDYNIGVVRVKE